MRDFILTFAAEEDAPLELRTGAPHVIPHCTRWLERPVFDAETQQMTAGSKLEGWHCIVRAEALADSLQPYIVTEPTDIEPLPAGGLMKPVVPQQVTRFQARMALLVAGMFEQVDALMKNPNTEILVWMAWNDAQVFERQSPTVLAIANALGLSEQQVDELFITAGKVTA